MIESHRPDPPFEQVLAPATGLAVVVEAGRRLRVTDLEGLQVVDMAVVNADNVREKLSCAYSRTRAGTSAGGGFHPRDQLSVGDVLMSTINHETLRITADTESLNLIRIHEVIRNHGIQVRIPKFFASEQFGHFILFHTGQLCGPDRIVRLGEKLHACRRTTSLQILQAVFGELLQKQRDNAFSNFDFELFHARQILLRLSVVIDI